MGYNLTIALINRTKNFLTPIKEVIYRGVSLQTGSEMLAPNKTTVYRYKSNSDTGINVRIVHEHPSVGTNKSFIIYIIFNFKLGFQIGCIASNYLIDYDILSTHVDKNVVITISDGT